MCRQSDTSFTRSDINVSESFWQLPGNVFQKEPERRREKSEREEEEENKKKVNDRGVLMRHC